MMPAAIIFVGFVLTMIGMSAYFMSQWTALESMGPGQAAAEFDRVRAAAGGGGPYVEVTAGGEVVVHREMEGTDRVSLTALHLMAWDSESGHLVRINFPYWFVRLKMSKHLNLGTMTSTLAGDWSQIDLRISERELELRGPGLVLDEATPGGARLLLWTE
jgi:hypothetical protein